MSALSPILPRPAPVENVSHSVESKSGKTFPIKGYVAKGWEKVQAAFEKNFAEDMEVGAGVTTYHKAQIVVDLVGGWADKEMTKPYEYGTIHAVHSSGKTIAAITTLQAISEGKFDFDDRIAKIWPEFGCENKEKVTVKELLEHSGGVAWIDPEFFPSPEMQLTKNLSQLASLIALQPHNHGGKTTRAYHAATRDWYTNELIRRTKGISHGELMIQLGHALGTRAYCGLPEQADQFFCKVIDSELRQKVSAAMPDIAGTPASKAMGGGRPGLPAVDGFATNNLVALRGQMPSGNTVANAHSLATYAAIMAEGGTFKGHTIMSKKVWERAHVVETENATQKDFILGLRFNVCHGGFFLNNEGTIWPQIVIDYADPTRPRLAKLQKVEKGKDYKWFGWFGMGGSHIQWNGEDRLASGYAPNNMFPGVNGDIRGYGICVATVETIRDLKAKEKL